MASETVLPPGMVLVSEEELRALRVLARKSLSQDPSGSSETHPALWGDAHVSDDSDHSSDDPAALLMPVDVPTGPVPIDWYDLTLGSRNLMMRLLRAYPAHVPMSELSIRFRRTDQHPELEDDTRGGAPSHVCDIRARLGRDSIETVYQTRTNRQGAIVRVGRALGYRLGQAYAPGGTK